MINTEVCLFVKRTEIELEHIHNKLRVLMALAEDDGIADCIDTAENMVNDVRNTAKDAAKQIDSIGAPGFKHKIVLTIPTPIAGQTDWGKLGNRTLIFDNYGDRSAAAIWFVNELVERFAKAGYKNLELSGLYWVDEDICHTKDLVKHIAPAVHAKGLEFIWIPYYRARGYDRWKEL